MLTLDTSALIALTNRKEQAHRRAVRAIQEERPPLLIPLPILSEVAYMLEQRAGRRAVDAVLLDIEEGLYTVSWHDRDAGRIRSLIERYADLDLGLADAAVIACAERSGGRLMTFDRRDFDVVLRGERSFTLIP